MAEPQPGRSQESGTERQRWRRWALWVVAAILVLFMALNSQSVKVNLIFGSAEMPLIFALLIAALLGALAGWVWARLRRSER